MWLGWIRLFINTYKYTLKATIFRLSHTNCLLWFNLDRQCILFLAGVCAMFLYIVHLRFGLNYKGTKPKEITEWRWASPQRIADTPKFLGPYTTCQYSRFEQNPKKEAVCHEFDRRVVSPVQPKLLISKSLFSTRNSALDSSTANSKVQTSSS